MESISEVLHTRYLTEGDWETVQLHYGKCESCGGTGKRHLHGIDATTGHRTCLSCQGQGLKNGFKNQWFSDRKTAASEGVLK